MRKGALLCFAALVVVGPSAAQPQRDSHDTFASHDAVAERKALITRAQVWRATDVRRMDLRAGPRGGLDLKARPRGGFAPDASITCEYVKKKLTGATPKFACRLRDGREVKIKYGGDNGEVYAEVAATRLLWALGFGADAMYPVHVTCRRCPATLGGVKQGDNEWFFERAAIELKMAGREVSDRWSWAELDEVDERTGGAPRAQRDALKLLAVLMQHTDSKPEQQRILCIQEHAHRCTVPLMMINDLGMTFGAANMFNDADIGSVNFAQWEKLSVWKDPTGCVGNLSGSKTGTLKYPEISEEGRRFLAALLLQLSDRQIASMFHVAHFDLRGHPPNYGEPIVGSIPQWVSAFKAKRAEIVGRRCVAYAPSITRASVFRSILPPLMTSPTFFPASFDPYFFAAASGAAPAPSARLWVN